MNITERRVEGQVQFWSLLGPSLILLAIAILVFKMSHHWYLPLGMLVGIPLCVKWQMKGLATALTFLFGLFIASYSHIPIQERYWHLGMGMAIALSFVILTLSLEEVKTLIGTMQAESQSRLDNFLRLDENVNVLEKSWVSEKESFLTQIESLSKANIEGQENNLVFQKLVYLAKDELIALRAQHELLLEDLLYKRQQIVQLNERLEENEQTIQTFVNTDPIKQATYLNERLEESDLLIEKLRSQIISKEEHLASANEENKILQEQLNALNQMHEKHNQDHSSLIEHAAQLKVEYDEKIKAQEQDYQSLQLSYGSLESELKSTHHNLKEKSRLIEETVNELSATRAQMEASHKALNTLQKEMQRQELEAKKQKEQFEVYLSEKEAFFNERANQIKNQSLHESSRLLEKKNQEIERVEEENVQLRQNIQETLLTITQVNEHAQGLECQCKQLESDLQQLKEELSQQKASIIHSPIKEDYFPQQARRVELRYNQLKEQFEEKNQVLDATRRELFLAQEQVLALQKDMGEMMTFDLSETETLLQKDFGHLLKEMEISQQQNQQEIVELYDLVESLLKQV